MGMGMEWRSTALAMDAVLVGVEEGVSVGFGLKRVVVVHFRYALITHSSVAGSIYRNGSFIPPRFPRLW